MSPQEARASHPRLRCNHRVLTRGVSCRRSPHPLAPTLAQLFSHNPRLLRPRIHADPQSSNERYQGSPSLTHHAIADLPRTVDHQAPLFCCPRLCYRWPLSFWPRLSKNIRPASRDYQGEKYEINQHNSTKSPQPHALMVLYRSKQLTCGRLFFPLRCMYPRFRCAI